MKISSEITPSFFPIRQQICLLFRTCSSEKNKVVEGIFREWKLYGRLVSKQGSGESLKILNAELFKRLQEIGVLHSIGL